MGELAYHRDPRAKELETEVVSVGRDDTGFHACLSDTICHPEGGGQPADHGWLGDARIVDVRWVDGAVRHSLDREVSLGPATLRLDWPRRFDHMQHHTGQHLLSAIAEDRFGWPTTSFHLKDGTCDVELDVAALSPDQVGELEEAVAGEIRAARRITPRWVSPEEHAGLRVRSRGLPPGHSGDVRLVEIAGVDLNTCGGTHLQATSEIESLHLLGTESLRGGTRLHFVAGGRARARSREHEARLAALRNLLDATDAELVDAAGARLTQLREQSKRQKKLLAELAVARAEAVATRDEPVLTAHFDGHDARFLGQVASALAGLAPRATALLTAETADTTFFAVVVGEQAGPDAPSAQELGASVADLLGGRGGGARGIYQGRCASLARRQEALDDLRSRVGGGW